MSLMHRAPGGLRDTASLTGRVSRSCLRDSLFSQAPTRSPWVTRGHTLPFCTGRRQLPVAGPTLSRAGGAFALFSCVVGFKTAGLSFLAWNLAVSLFLLLTERGFCVLHVEIHQLPRVCVCICLCVPFRSLASFSNLHLSEVHSAMVGRGAGGSARGSGISLGYCEVCKAGSQLGRCLAAV